MGQRGTADENSYSCVHHSRVQELVNIAENAWNEKDKACVTEEIARVLYERTLEEVLKERSLPPTAIAIDDDRSSVPPRAASPLSPDDDCYAESRSA
jgi:hypothetical protein